MPHKKGAGPTARTALVHALVHIENRAIELAWDVIVRDWPETQGLLPAEFFLDWLQVAEDEARHYTKLDALLQETYKARYGDLPAHGGLWSDALRTKDSLEARLVLEHCVHEAKGLDVTQLITIPKFIKGEDHATAALLADVILPEEVQHVRKGLKWFKWLRRLTAPDAANEEQNVTRFRQLVREHFSPGALRGPFNEVARTAAGMSPEYYQYGEDTAARHES